MDAQGRIYYLSPEVIRGNVRGRTVEPARLRRVFRLRQQTRQVLFLQHSVILIESNKNNG